MAKKTKIDSHIEARAISVETSKVIEKDDDTLLTEVQSHYKQWTEDNQLRTFRKGGWKDIMDAYWGKLPDDWPFISKTVDPRIRTSLLEKNARLTNRTLKGKVTPKKGTTIIKARINGAVIDNQWDNANEGGSMQQKISACDMDARLLGSKFAYVYWKELRDTKGELKFDGNEMKPIDGDDCGIDPNCEHIRSAKWFQHRMWMPVEQIIENKDLYGSKYDRLMKLITVDKKKFAQKRRDVLYNKRIKQLKGLEDRLGTDPSFPVIEWVIEYRVDKWIIFCPDYSLLMSVEDNPYDHQNIPISQLRYYPINGDNLGESEVESSLPLWRAIQAFLCAFMDEAILKMRPPLKVVEGAVRIETIVYQPEAMWLMDNVNAVTEVESRADSIKYFQSTYPMLVSAFNTAMGDMSQGTSNVDPLSADKTATEIRQIAKQQNTRDQKNQSELAEFLKDVVGMWIANNKQFLFRDPEKKEHLLQIMGDDNYNYFKREGMDEMILPDEVAQVIQEIMGNTLEAGGEMDPTTLQNMIEAGQIPKYPIITNPNEKDPNKLDMKTKLRPTQLGDGADLIVTPDDTDGSYDYIPDIKSMESGAGEQLMFARTQAIAQVTNPNVLQLLAAQGVKPLIKDLLIADFEDKGLNDASKYFETIQSPQGQATAGTDPTGGVLSPEATLGMGNVPQAPTQPSIDQQMAGSNQVPQ